MHKRFRQGFTIVEVVTAIFIIAVLAVITVLSYNTVQAQARDSKRQSDVTIMLNALERYYDKNGEYPTGCTQGTTTYTPQCEGGPFDVTTNTDVVTMNMTTANLRTMLPSIPSTFGDPKQVEGAAFGNGRFQSPIGYFYIGELVANGTGSFGTKFTSNYYAAVNCSSGTTIAFTTTVSGTRTSAVIGHYNEVEGKWYIYQTKNGKHLTAGSTDVRGSTYGICTFVQ